ncbi:hypothetical protein ACQB60_13025 [Actinomycetota bacterium Odt1-20B]
MHGPGYAQPHPPAPSGGTHVTLRVVFVVLAVITCGLAAWAPLLRLAVVTRKAHDWVLFGLVAALDGTALVLIAVDPGDDEFTGSGNAGMAIMVCTMFAAVIYYLVADIRHFGRLALQQAQFMGYASGAQAHPQAQPSYGYPPQQPAPGPAPVHFQQTQTHPQQPPRPEPQQGPHTPPPPARPAPARIHQVRAELDELSDYLRKQEGGN